MPDSGLDIDEYLTRLEGKVDALTTRVELLEQDRAVRKAFTGLKQWVLPFVLSVASLLQIIHNWR